MSGIAVEDLVGDGFQFRVGANAGPAILRFPGSPVGPAASGIAGDDLDALPGLDIARRELALMDHAEWGIWGKIEDSLLFSGIDGKRPLFNLTLIQASL